MINSNNLDMSFSGLKTSVLYTVQKIDDLNDNIKSDIAASFQSAVRRPCRKIKKAVKLTNESSVIIAGGVAANNFLRKEIKNLEDKNGISVYYPSMKYCTDNAAMIAFVGSKMSHEK